MLKLKVPSSGQQLLLSFELGPSCLAIKDFDLMVSWRPRAFKFIKRYESRMCFGGWEGIFPLVIELEVI